MNVPIPTPTPEQIAASLALENSRRQYRLQDRATILFMHRPDVVLTARDGEPTLSDPAPTLAPHVTNQIQKDYSNAFAAPDATGAPGTLNPQPKPSGDQPPAAAPAEAAAAPAAAAPAAATPLQLQDVPAADASTAGAGTAAVTSVTNAAPAASAPAGNSMGVEIITPGANAGPPAASQPAPSSTANPSDNGGLHAVGPVNSTPLPAAEKPAAAPDAVNDVADKPQPAAQSPNANGKNPKPAYDKNTESDSKHKKKKGLAKLNPF